MTAEVRELLQLATVLQASVAEAQEQMVAVVTRGALNIKNGWRDNAVASAGRHARLYPYSISYDVTPIPGGATAEIGPDKGRPQGPLGNLLEFGSSKNPPHNDGGRALLAEAPRFEAQVALMVDRLGPR
ncbi:hypothetical protein HYE82_03585 [Streptomyces sp. BR123]|uniref:hypothetical protein n=1 Tax=Streptomyces sp. BR123 TaxID=2749828 RepID=UPI0015C4D770|nr:hypothetical protein [Streptomyces sp. BR123]NXY93504.1 hypothetical protein [Streptomyces sp. BR123]